MLDQLRPMDVVLPLSAAAENLEKISYMITVARFGRDPLLKGLPPLPRAFSLKVCSSRLITIQHRTESTHLGY